MFKLGQFNESHHSKLVHQAGIPFLVSSQFLRRYGAGQIDLAHINQLGELVLFEVKSTTRMQGKQILRIYKSGNLLAKIVERKVRVKVIFCQKEFPFLS